MITHMPTSVQNAGKLPNAIQPTSVAHTSCGVGEGCHRRGVGAEERELEQVVAEQPSRPPPAISATSCQGIASGQSTKGSSAGQPDRADQRGVEQQRRQSSSASLRVVIWNIA